MFLVCISTQNVFAINAPDDNLIKQWGWSNVTTDFHAPSVKNRIKSVSFLTNDDIPDNVITSWDVSDASHPGKVKAWIVNSSKSSYFDEYYDLYIGADGGVKANSDSGYLFFAFDNLETVNFNNSFDTSDVTNMTEMFYSDEKIQNINFDGFDTSNVTNMEEMFLNCGSLEKLDLSDFNTSNVISMYSMFNGCANLNTIIVSDLWYIDNNMNLSNIFNNCNNLTGFNGTRYLDSSIEKYHIDSYNYSGYFSPKLSFYSNKYNVEDDIIIADINNFSLDDFICDNCTLNFDNNYLELYYGDLLIKKIYVLLIDTNLLKVNDDFIFLTNSDLINSYFNNYYINDGYISSTNNSLNISYKQTQFKNINKEYKLLYLTNSHGNFYYLPEPILKNNINSFINLNYDHDNFTFVINSNNLNNEFVSENDTLSILYKNEIINTYNIDVKYPIKSINLGNDITLELYKNKSINVGINPLNTTDKKTFYWSSSNNNVAIVDSTGNVKAVGLGSAEITVCTKNGICDSVVITVTKVNANSLSYSGIGNRIYTGKQIKPGVTIKYNGMTLKNGTDYTLSYAANKNTGKGSVKITLKGNYTGSKTLYFNIIPKKVAISSVKSNSKKTATIKYKKTTGASVYQIAYRLKGSKTWKYTTSTKLSKKITKLKRYKKYNFKVRAYKTIDGKKYYGAYSSTKTIKIK